MPGIIRPRRIQQVTLLTAAATQLQTRDFLQTRFFLTEVPSALTACPCSWDRLPYVTDINNGSPSTIPAVRNIYRRPMLTMLSVYICTQH